MKRIKILFVLLLLPMVSQGAWADGIWSVWDGHTTTKPSVTYDGSAATSIEHWQVSINSAAELAWVMQNMGTNAEFTAEVKMTESYWETLSQYVHHCCYNLNINCDMTAGQWQANNYWGIFNGNGHTIRLKIENATDNYQGLFKEIYSGGKVKNLRVDGKIACSSSRLVGGIAGQNDGTIENCWVSANVSSDWREPASAYTAKVGGIAGENQGTIQYCCVTGNVTNNDADVGGIAGYNKSGATIRRITFYGTRNSTHSQDYIYVGDNDGALEWVHDAFSQDEYDNSAGYELYRQAIKYPWTVNVMVTGHGSPSDVEDNTDGGTFPGRNITFENKSLYYATFTAEKAGGGNIAYSTTGTNFWRFDMPKSDVNVTIRYARYSWQNEHDGTESDPYLISNKDEWEQFASTVNNGEAYSGKFFKLTGDIASTSTMAGLPSSRPFSGIFDGDGHTLTVDINTYGPGAAPFRYIKNATIKNLTTAGEIQANNTDAGGIVAYADGTNLIDHCAVTAFIRPEWYHGGGFIGNSLSSSTTIRDCVFAGRLRDITTNGSCALGGFFGWSEGGSPVLSHCLEMGSYERFMNGSVPSIWNPMGYLGSYGAITDCYFVNPKVGSHDKFCPSDPSVRVYASEPAGLRRQVSINGYTAYFAACSVSGIEASYDLKASGGTVSITPVLTDPNSTVLNLGTDFTATLGGENVTAFPVLITTMGVKTLTLTGEGSYYGSKSFNIVVTGLDGDGTEANPYLIHNSDEWDAFALDVSVSGNSYSGKYVSLAADISVTTMAGADGKNFCGTFDGNGHTLTFTKGTAGEPFSEENCAPFRYLCDATIKNLVTGGDIYTSRKYAAGLVAYTDGTVNITNCVVGTIIHSSVNGDGTHGGIVSRVGNVTALNIAGCVFNGRLFTTSGTNSCGGIVGWWNSRTVTISHSLYAPDINAVAVGGETPITGGATFIRGGSVGEDCRYTETLGTAQGKQANVFDAAPAGLGSQLQDYGFVTAYEGGILFGGKYYYWESVVLSANDGGDDYFWSSYFSSASSYIADENTLVYLAAVKGSTVVLTVVPGREIPTGTPVILRSSNSSITLTASQTSATTAGNELLGGSQVTEGYDAYTLSRGEDGTGAIGFYKFSGESLSADKVHLEIPQGSPAAAPAAMPIKQE